MARMLGAWQRVADALGDVDTGLVVGHGASLRALMCAMTGTPAAEQRRWQLHNAGLSRLRWDNGALVVDYWDDGTHLVAPGPIRGTASRGDPRGDVPRRSPVRARPGTNPPARPMR